MTSEIYSIVDDTLANTFYISPSGNICLTGKCDERCDTHHGICADGDILEGSFAAFLPTFGKEVRRKVI